jgi:DNA-binding HxlR family transcriptional regulator
MSGRREWLPNDVCSVAQSLEVIGERWTILILREAFLGTRRFDDFHHNLGCARNLLTARLRKLEAHGILDRRRYQDRPPRFEYRLTDKGVDLYPALIALMAWGDRYLAAERGPAIVLEHTTCGHTTTPEFVCPRCGDRVHARDMTARIGPGALIAGAKRARLQVPV